MNASSNRGFGGGSQTDLDGRYSIALRPDIYFIHIQPRQNTAFVPQNIEQLEVKEARTLDIVLEEGILLSGRVTGPDGNPVQDAHVHAGDRDRSDGDEGWARTERDGTYRLPLPAGVYEVVAEPPGGSELLRETILDVNLTADLTLDITLTQGLILSGQASRPDGEGLFEVQINVFNPQTGEWFGTQTQRDGTYQLALPPGTYGLRAEPPQGSEFVIQEIQEFEFTDSQTLDLIFDRGIVLSGRVIDPDGNPVREGWINAFAPPRDNFGTGIHSDGTYLLAMPPGDYEISVYPRFGSDLIEKRLSAVEVRADRELEIELERGVTLSGQVSDAQGNPVLQVNVHAEGEKGFGGGAPVDPEGRYRIPLSPGTYSVFFEPFGGRLVRKVVEDVDVTAPRILDVQLDDGATISGIVTDPSGVEVADVFINAFIGEEFRYVSGTRSFFDGSYSIALPPGTYNLIFEPQPGSPYVRQILKDIDVDGDELLDVALTLGLTLSGQVTGPSGAGIAQAGVSMRNIETDESFGTGTDPNGEYRQVLPPGTYVISVGPPPDSRLGFKEIPDVRVVMDLTLPITLETQIGLTGQVLDPDENPVPFAHLSAEVAGEGRGGTGTDDQGFFNFPLPAGTYTIIIYPPRGTTLKRTRVEDVTVSEGEEPRNLTIQKGIGLSGKVTDADGQGLEEIGINLFNESDREWVGTSTSAGGSYGIGLGAGTYEINVVPFDPASPHTPKRLTSIDISSDLTLDFTLDTGFVVSGRVTDPDGNGIPHVGINGRDESGENFGRGTDEVGFYSLALPPGTYELEAYPPPGSGFIPNHLEGVEVSGDLTLDIPLDRGITLKGSVTDASGAAVDGVGVGVFNPETGKHFGGGTNIDGEYAVALPPATYRVEFYPPEGRGLVREEFESILIEADHELNVTLERGVVLSGRILTPSGDRGVRDVEMIFILAGVGPEGFANTNVDGFYSVALPVGTYTIGYNPPVARGYLPALEEGVEVGQNLTLDFTLEEGTAVLGRVSGPDDASVSGAIVTATGADGKAFSSITSSDGLFRVVVQPGVYDIRIEPSAGSGLSEETIQSVDTSAGEPLEVQLAESSDPVAQVGAVKVTPSTTSLPADGTSTATLTVTITEPDGSLSDQDNETSVVLNVDGPAVVKPSKIPVKGGIGSAVITSTTVAGKIEVTAASAGLIAGVTTLTSFPATAESDALSIDIGPVVTDITASTAAVLWITSQESDGVVEYGTTRELGSTQEGDDSATEHRILLADLEPLTVYQYRVQSGGTISGTLSFTTGAAATENRESPMGIDLDPAEGNQGLTTLTEAEAGQEVDLLIYGKEITNAGGFVVELDFDPDAVEFVSAQGGTDSEENLLALNGGNPLFLPPLLKDGSIRYGGSILGPTQGTVVTFEEEEEGLFGRITFRFAEDFGAGRETKITLTSVTLRGLSASQQDVIRPLTSATLSSGQTAGGGDDPIVLDLDLSPGFQGLLTLSGLQPGEAFDLEVAATTGAIGATGFTASLEYNPKELMYVSFEEGSLIPGLTGLPNPGDGIIEVGGSILGAGSGAEEDNGTLATVRFQANEDFVGTASITLTSASLRKGSGQEKFTLGSVVEIEISSADAGEPNPDFNGDGKVDFTDFFDFANAFGTKTGDPDFDPKFDLDRSGEVEFGDFFEFAGAFTG